MTQGLSSMGMALSSIQGLWSTLTDPDTSGFEKFLAVLTSSGMVVGSFSSGLSSLKEGLNLIRTATDGTTAAMLKQAMQMKTSELQENSWLAKIKEKIAARKAEEAAAKASIVTKQQETIVTAGSAEASEEKAEEDAKGALANVADAAASGGDTVAKGAEAAATTGAGVAQTFLNTTLFPFIALMGAALAAVLPFIAAAGILAAVVGAVAYAVTAENRAMEECAAREERAAEMSKKVAEENDKIAASLSEISSKTDTFDELTKGTTEWYQTLNEVNAEIQNLIDKYPELVEMGFITRDANGMLGITDEGEEYISKEMAKDQAVASNIELKAKQNTLQTEVDYGWDDFGSDINGAYLTDNEAKAMVLSYQQYGDAMFTNAEYMQAALDNMAKAYSDTMDYGDFDEAEMKAYFEEHEDQIKAQAERLQQIDDLDKQMIQNRMAAYGSIRTADQAVELMGGTEGFTSISGEGNERALTYTQDGEQKTFNMNKHVNYTDEDMPQEIKDFMAMQGEDVEYVAQRNGKLVLEVDGEEVEFSEDEVYDAVGEVYAEEAFEQKLRDNLTTTLGNAVSGIDKLSTDDLIQLDNLQVGLENLFEGEADPAGKAQEVFTKIVNAYGNTQEDLEALSRDTQYVDMNSAAFERLAKNASLSGDAMKQAIQELNAIGKIESMGAFFTEQAESMGLDAEAATDMQDYAKHLMETADELEGISDSIATNADSAADLAVEITRMNKGVETLADNFSDWNDVLKNSSKGSMEYSKAMSGMKKAVADVLDVEADMISSDFIDKHSDDIEKAATGDAEAIDRLRASMDEEIIGNIKLERPDLTNLDTLDADVKSKLDAALEKLEVPDIEVGAILDDADFLAAANELVETSGMSADEANAYFAGIGYEPLYNQEEIPDANVMSAPNVRTVTTVEGINWAEENMTIGDTELPIKMPQISVKTQSTPLPSSETDGPMTLTSFSGDGTPPKIQGLRRRASGSQNNYSSTNAGGGSPGSKGGGGGGSKPKKTKESRKSKSDFVDRYKEINDQLEETGRQMKKNTITADGLWGEKRISMLKKNINLMKQERKELEDKYNLAKKYLKEDKNNLQKQSGQGNSAEAKAQREALGMQVNFSFDENGYITNYTSEMTKLYNKREALLNSFGSTMDEKEQERLEQFDKAFDNLKSAYEQYETTMDERDDLEEEKMQKKIG